MNGRWLHIALCEALCEGHQSCRVNWEPIVQNNWLKMSAQKLCTQVKCFWTLPHGLPKMLIVNFMAFLLILYLELCPSINHKYP